MKVCNRCHIEKTEDCFGKNKNAHDGLDHYCRDCRKAYRAEHRESVLKSKAKYREEHREQIREYNRSKYVPHPIVKKTDEEKRQTRLKYKREHREQILEYGRQYRENNKEKCSELTRRWYHTNRERVREYNRRYKLEHPEKYKAQHKANKQRRRARLKGNGGTYTPEELRGCLSFFNFCCAYSGEPLEDDYHIDHIVPLSKGGRNDIGNIVPSNREPNLDKSDKNIFEWFRNSKWFDADRYERLKEWIEVANAPCYVRRSGAI